MIYSCSVIAHIEDRLSGDRAAHKQQCDIVLIHQMRVSHLLHRTGFLNVGPPSWGAAGGI